MSSNVSSMNVAAVVGIIQQMIAQKGLTTGSKLPSVREMSVELGVNRNTVYSAYKKLEASNVVSMRRGSGVYIKNVGTELPDTTKLKEELRTYLVAARLSSMEEEDARALILDILHEVYRDQSQKILFVECNTYDAETIRNEIMTVLPIQVVPMTLQDVYENPGILNEYQVVCTTYYHIKELEEFHFDGKLIALHHAINAKSVHEISKISRGTTLGIVSSNERTLSLIKSLVTMFNHTQINECLTDDEEALRRTITDSDIIITHFNGAVQIEKIEHNLSIIMVRFHIEQESIDYLRESLMPSREVFR